MQGVGEALAQVVAARERLARPLTIAIMGEFSAGKSTFVNALLGEAVAPMGVLPTTTTINTNAESMARYPCFTTMLSMTLATSSQVSMLRSSSSYTSFHLMRLIGSFS